MFSLEGKQRLPKFFWRSRCPQNPKSEHFEAYQWRRRWAGDQLGSGVLLLYSIIKAIVLCRSNRCCRPLVFLFSYISYFFLFIPTCLARRTPPSRTIVCAALVLSIVRFNFFLLESQWGSWCHVIDGPPWRRIGFVSSRYKLVLLWGGLVFLYLSLWAWSRFLIMSFVRWHNKKIQLKYNSTFLPDIFD